MGTLVFELTHTDMAPHWRAHNLGALVEANRERIADTCSNVMLVRLCNATLYGSYQVPCALGFSTPLSALGSMDELHVTFCRNEEQPVNKLLAAYDDWHRVFCTEVTRWPGTTAPLTPVSERPLERLASAEKQSLRLALDTFAVSLNTLSRVSEPMRHAHLVGLQQRYASLMMRVRDALGPESAVLTQPLAYRTLTADQLTCSICLADYDAGVQTAETACGHRYHSACIEQWCATREHAACPRCAALLSRV